jgi:hypothetical protein
MKWLLRKLVLLFWLGVFALVGYLAIFAFAGFSAEYPFAQRGLAVPKGTVIGAYHVHSSESGGRATPTDIAWAAKHAGLSFVIITEHNPQTIPEPRYEAGVLLMFGMELSTPAGHLVAIGVPRTLEAEERAQDPFELIPKLGGYTFIAHPIQTRQPWTAWDKAAKATGLELYSGDTMFREAMAEPFTRLLPAAGAYLTNPTHGMFTVVQDQPKVRTRLLELSTGAEPKVALCAHDAHGIPPYDDEFKMMALYLPPDEVETPFVYGDAQKAAAYVATKIGHGYAYCVFRALGDGTGFGIEGLEGSERKAKVGGKLKVVLPAGTPAEARVQVTGPGKLQPDGRSVVLEKAGAVQLEVWRRTPGRFFESEWKPWIVPSPVLVHE